MFKVTFRFESGEPVEAFAAAEENLLEVARKTNVAIDAPCSGNGSCGKCKVKLLKGTLDSPRTRHITEEEYAEGWRLSCCSKIESDIEVEVPDIASAYRSRMKVADLSSQEELAIFQQAKSDVEEAGILLKNDMEILDVVMDSPSLDDTMPDNERLMRAIKKQTGAKIVRLPYTVIRKLADVLRENDLPCAALSEEQETKRISLYMMFLQRKKS
ncbi:MAG: 2Fe-2S iron-sulfur cluster-binding protein [Ruminococcus sp.]